MTIIGFDTGLRNLGWGVISYVNGEVECHDHGVIRTPTKLPYGASLRQIRRDAMSILEYSDVDYIAIEDMHPVMANRIASIKGTNYVIGVLHELAIHMGYPEPFLISPTTMKKRVTGNGRADKKAVIEAVVQQLTIHSLKTQDNHAIDALGVALAAIEEITNVAV